MYRSCLHLGACIHQILMHRQALAPISRASFSPRFCFQETIRLCLGVRFRLTGVEGFPHSCQERICLQCRRPGFDPCVGNIPWRRKWQPTPVFLPGKFQGQRSLEGCSPWGRTESDNAEHAGMERETERSGLKAETDRE